MAHFTLGYNQTDYGTVGKESYMPPKVVDPHETVDRFQEREKGHIDV